MNNRPGLCIEGPYKARDYSDAIEYFENAIHILCSNASYQSRLKLAYGMISLLTPLTDLPEELVSKYYELQHIVNKHNQSAGVDTLTDRIDSLNTTEISLIVNGFVTIHNYLTLISENEYDAEAVI